MHKRNERNLFISSSFPLFCRVTPPPNVLLYGVYLLNQNISQLKFMLNMHRGDLRATLANLWDLMNGINAEMYSRRFVEDVKPTENSASSMDSVPINVPLSLSPLSRRYARLYLFCNINQFKFYVIPQKIEIAGRF